MSRKSQPKSSTFTLLVTFTGALWAILSLSTGIAMAESSHTTFDHQTFLSAPPEEPDLDLLTLSSPRFRKSSQSYKIPHHPLSFRERERVESPESEEATPCCKDATPASIKDLRKLTEELGKTLNEVFLIGTPPSGGSKGLRE